MAVILETAEDADAEDVNIADVTGSGLFSFCAAAAAIPSADKSAVKTVLF